LVREARKFKKHGVIFPSEGAWNQGCPVEQVRGAFVELMIVQYIGKKDQTEIRISNRYKPISQSNKFLNKKSSFIYLF